jgi:NADH dehydrogenase
MKNKIRRFASEFDPQPFHVDDKAARLQRARALGEQYVRDAYPKATILRPSVIFGPGDAFFNVLARLTRRIPFLPA